MSFTNNHNWVSKAALTPVQLAEPSSPAPGPTMFRAIHDPLEWPASVRLLQSTALADRGAELEYQNQPYCYWHNKSFTLRAKGPPLELPISGFNWRRNENKRSIFQTLLPAFDNAAVIPVKESRTQALPSQTGELWRQSLDVGEQARVSGAFSGLMEY
jgi:hypothetical protein